MPMDKNDVREVPIWKNEIVATSGKNENLKRVSVIGVIALAAFLLGFLPAWLSARNYESERDAAAKTLRPSVLQNVLATATINAGRGEFELARQQTSDFFTVLQAEFDREESAFSQSPQREAVEKILARRDEMITQLARNDAAADDHLTDLYFAFMRLKNSPAPEKK